MNPVIQPKTITSPLLIVLLLLAVCAIPFALAQRNPTKRSAANSSLSSLSNWPRRLRNSALAACQVTCSRLQRSPRAGEHPSKERSFGAVLRLWK